MRLHPFHQLVVAKFEGLIVGSVILLLLLFLLLAPLSRVNLLFASLIF